MSRQFLNATTRTISKIAPTNAGHLTVLAVAFFAILAGAAPLRALNNETKKPIANSQFDFWADLSAGRVNHPLRLFAYPQMKETIETLIGNGESTLKDVVEGPGSIEHRNDLFVAESCLPHHCVSDSIIFILDAKNKTAFIAWKLSEKPLAVRPSVEQWTPQARTELDKWAERLRDNEAFLTSLKTKNFAPSNTATDDLLDDLRNKRLSKPEDIFKHPGMTMPIEILLAGYRETVMSMVRGGQGTLEDKSNIIVGTSCPPNECAEKSLFFAFDLAKKQVFLAWKAPGQPINVKPVVEEWSQPAKAELTTWSKPYTAAAQSGGKKPQ